MDIDTFNKLIEFSNNSNLIANVAKVKIDGGEYVGLRTDGQLTQALFDIGKEFTNLPIPNYIEAIDAKNNSMYEQASKVHLIYWVEWKWDPCYDNTGV